MLGHARWAARPGQVRRCAAPGPGPSQRRKRARRKGRRRPSSAEAIVLAGKRRGIFSPLYFKILTRLSPIVKEKRDKSSPRRKKKIPPVGRRDRLFSRRSPPFDKGGRCRYDKRYISCQKCPRSPLFCRGEKSTQIEREPAPPRERGRETRCRTRRLPLFRGEGSLLPGKGAGAGETRSPPRRAAAEGAHRGG